MEVIKREKEKKWLRLLMLPLSIVVGIIPLIVRMKETHPKESIQSDSLHISEYFDCFSQNKAYVLMITSIIMLILLFFFWDKYYIKRNKYIKIGLCGVGIFTVAAVLSTVCSEYRELAIWGTYDRAEGFITISCYIIVFLYSIYAFNEYNNIYFIIVPLMILIVCNVILGVSQYFGQDLYMTSDFVKKLIVPDEMAEVREQLAISYAEGRVYGTVGHYNYMGSFAALLVPFFAILTIMLKGITKKIGLGVVLIGILFLLFGSTSRAGLVGVVCAVLLILILLGKLIIKHWKIGLVIIGTLGILLVVFNFITSGSIFSRIPSLAKDILQVAHIGGEKVDYRDYLPMREFKNEDGEVIVVLQEGEMHFNLVDEKIVVTDSEGNLINYEKVKNETNQDDDGRIYGTYTTQNADYSNIEFVLGTLYIDEQDTDAILIRTAGDEVHFTCRIDYDKQTIQQIDEWSGKDVEQETSPSFGFKGHEKLGSARGYIWSRTLPMLKDTIFIGKGPDNFVAYFPKYDSLAKLWAYGVSKYIIDKPHDLYLQIAYNEGILALIGFLLLTGSYLIQSIKLYAFKKSYNKNQVFGMAIMAGIVGYLVAGIFNDSVVSVAPIFWTFLGIGFALNDKLSKEDQVMNKEQKVETIV